MKLSDYVIDFLAKQGIKHSFVVSGGAIIHLINSCSKHPLMDYICSQHEQNAAASADMYARISGKIGLVMTTSGPGATNLTTSVCNAYFDSVPLICLTGQVARFRIRKTKKLRQRGFQETDVVSIFSSITKYSKQVIDPTLIRYELEKALYYATEGRPGPVLLDIPDDLQREEIDEKKLIGFTPPGERKKSFEDKLLILQRLLMNTKRPVIIFGAGVHIAKVEKKALDFIKALQIPVLLTWGAKSLLPYDHPLNMGGFGICGPRAGNFCVQNSDLVIALGTRLSQMITGGKQSLFATKAKKVMVDIDCEELKKFDSSTFELDLAINCDLNDFFNGVLKQLKNFRLDSFEDWTLKIEKWKEKFPIVSPISRLINKRINPYCFIEELSKLCKKDQIFIGDTGANLCWIMQAFKFKEGQRIFSAWNHTPMGFALPASIGAALASNQEIICLMGDGGLMMCLSELATIRRNNLPIKIFIFDNQCHGIQKQTMDTWLQSQYSAADVKTGLYFPDYQKIAEAFDLPFKSIKSQNEMKDVINKVLSSPGPFFCNIEIIEDQKIIPMLKFGSGLEDLDPKISQEELAEIMNQEEIIQGRRE